MKNIILVAFFLLAFVVISCQKEAVNNNSNAIKVTGQVASDKSLKTTFINPSVDWIANVDHIGVFSDLAYTSPGVLANNVDYSAQASSPIANFSSTTPVYFDGTTNTHHFGAYYPYSPAGVDYHAIPISLPADQTQIGTTTDHIGTLDFEVASVLHLPPVPGGVNPVVAFSFNHVFTILKFDLTCMPDNSLASIQMATDGPAVAISSATIDIGQFPLEFTPAAGQPYTLTGAPGGLNVTLHTNLSISSPTPSSAYMVILPGDQSGFTFSFLFTSTTGQTFFMTKPGILFERGKVYTITQTLTW